ncbi:MAG: NADH-quinone oxidoreductase subunit C [Chloroflexota bacterium]
MTVIQRFDVLPDGLPAECAEIVSARGGRLATMVALDERREHNRFRLIYVFAVSGGWINVESSLDGTAPRHASVTPLVPAAYWYEREARDLLGIEPVGHPDPRRLVHHDDWPDGVYPLRKDFRSTTPIPRITNQQHQFHHLHGDGIVEIPVGPIHAGVIEPGHFRFAAVGERVLHLETRLFYTHRGIEKLAEGKDPHNVLQIAERVCGVCACSHAVSYCQAIEDLTGATVPARAAAIRSILLELERLYNHAGDLGNMCAGTGFAVGAAQGAWLKEQLQRLNERVSGNRYLRGICRVGGLRRDLSREMLGDIRRTLADLAGQFERFVDLFESTESFQERMRRTGVVSREAATAMGAVGVAARAAGVGNDARLDHPHAGYSGVGLPLAIEREGDAGARARVRIAETRTSLKLVDQLIATLPRGPVLQDVGPLPGHREGLGVTESPRGENVHWVRTAANGTIERYRVRSASFCNWPVVAMSVPGNMVPDFPLINKSFELCYSCLDR